MRIFTTRDDVSKYIELLVASKDVPLLFDVFVRDTWRSINKTYPSIRASFYSQLREKGLFDQYIRRVRELGLP
ncbi:MAG: hypothetical protein ACPLXS_03775 [Candidatus Micrarchaeales archaeon]|jgi:hypothetical protein